MWSCACSILIRLRSKHDIYISKNYEKITFQRSCLHRRIRIGGSSIFLSPSSDTIQSHSFLQHALSKTLLKPTRLARFSPALVYFAFAVRRTRVFDIACEITRYFIVIYMVLIQVAPISVL